VQKESKLRRDGDLDKNSDQIKTVGSASQIYDRDELQGAKDELNYSPVTIPQSV
jgi:hypothetical protein